MSIAVGTFQKTQRSEASRAIQPLQAPIFDGTRRTRWPVVGPLIALLVITAVFRCTSLDLAISGCFFDAEHELWPWYASDLGMLFRRRGVYPAMSLAIVAVGWLLWSLVRARTWRSVQGSVFLLAVFAIGPGLIINQGLKNSWGRPRPLQVQSFGGEYAYVPLGTPGMLRLHNSSFPSGHAAVAFYLMTPAFLVDARRRRLARALLFGGAAFGGAMSVVRVMQGAHFTSDVVWSAAIVYFTSVLLARLLLRPAIE